MRRDDPLRRTAHLLRIWLLAGALLGAGCHSSGGTNPAPTAAPNTAVAPAAAANQKPHARLFVSNYRDDTLSVIDLDREREEKIVPMPESPEGLALRTNPPLLAIANSTASYVTLMDPVSLEVLGTIPCGVGPDDLVFSHDGKLLFVTSGKEVTVYVLDVEKRSTVEVLPEFRSRPVRLEISPDGTRLYVLAKSTEGEIVALDTTTRKIVGRAPVGPNPTDLGISADGKWVLGAAWDNNLITVIDTATMTVKRTFTADTGFGLLLHPTKPIAYSMASFDDEVHVLDYEQGKTLKVLELGNFPSFSAISPDGKYLYVVHEESDNVVKLDTETNEMVTRIAVGEEPSEAIYFTMP